MRPINQQNETMKNAMKVAKRIALTMLCCVPVMGIFAYLTRNIITADWLQILCFILIMGVAVLCEEIIARTIIKKKAAEAILETKKDVFK